MANMQTQRLCYAIGLAFIVLVVQCWYMSSKVLQKNDMCWISLPVTIKHKAIHPNDTCDAEFCSSQEGNKRKILSYNLSEAEPYLRQLAPDSNRNVIYSIKTKVEVPVLVSGASSNHYREALMLIKNLNTYVRPIYSNTQFYFFDLGLTASEKLKVQAICNCTVVPFPFEEYPSHVRQLKAYCWKPVLIKMMLQSYRFVMWMDTSIRFKTSDLDSLFEKGKLMGILSKPSRHRFLASRVHEDTFIFLKEPPCLYRTGTIFQGGILLFHSEHKLLYDYIIQPWVACALIEDCMKTRHEPKLILPNCSDAYHSCHRYDQAVLSILIIRLFTESANDHVIDSKYLFVDRGKHIQTSA